MKSVHLMGIGGTGMVALAGLFQERGWAVRGSDAKVYPPASTELARMGIDVREGYRAENLEPKPDLVVVGNVITRKNPEAEALLKSGLSYTSMAQALAAHFLAQRRSIVVAGTHGKTTTTSLVAWILECAGQSPGLFVGGVPLDFSRGYRLGSGEPFVVEGDEYDTAFFEKTPKFLHYRPHDCILTSVEFDHADIYRDLAHVVGEFEKLVALIPSDGLLVANGDSETIRKLLACRKGLVQTYGRAPSSEWRAVNATVTAEGSRFVVEKEGRREAEISWQLLGQYNVDNGVAAFALARHLGVEARVVAQAMANFRGVRRRQEFLGEARGAKFYDDYAHHPTAIEATLSAFEPLAKASGGKLWAVFEPRSNTVRRRVFQDMLPESFSKADRVILAPVYRKADSLTDAELLSPQEVAIAIRKKARDARAPVTMAAVSEILVAEVARGDVVVFMSNGDFGGLPRGVVRSISESRG